MYLNIAATTFAGWTNKVIADDVFKSHMLSIFGGYTGDKNRLLRLIDLAGYDKPFQDACKAFIVEPHTTPSPTMRLPIPYLGRPVCTYNC